MRHRRTVQENFHVFALLFVRLKAGVVKWVFDVGREKSKSSQVKWSLKSKSNQTRRTGVEGVFQFAGTFISDRQNSEKVGTMRV